MRRKILAAASLAALIVLSSVAQAADVHGRVRVSLAFGADLPRGEVSSNSASVLLVQDASGATVDQFIDPRNDAGISGSLDFKSTQMASLTLQYGVTRRVVIEGSVGYLENDVGDIEVQATPITFLAAIFAIERVPAGTLTRVPLQLTALYRFRPGFDFSPYAGAGFGYQVIGFEPSDELDRLSFDMDNSKGALALLSSLENGNFIRPPNPAAADFLTGATVSATDSYSWHLAAGAEYAFTRHVALYVDLRYVDATGRFRIGFNNDNELGSSVPDGSVPVGDPSTTVDYGPMSITEGGLVDFDGDGQPDPGLYYVQGGTLQYGGFSLQLGARFTF